MAKDRILECAQKLVYYHKRAVEVSKDKMDAEVRGQDQNVLILTVVQRKLVEKCEEWRDKLVSECISLSTAKDIAPMFRDEPYEEEIIEGTNW